MCPQLADVSATGRVSRRVSRLILTGSFAFELEDVRPSINHSYAKYVFESVLVQPRDESGGSRGAM
jgi:hypothetical protein